MTGRVPPQGVRDHWGTSPERGWGCPHPGTPEGSSPPGGGDILCRGRERPPDESAAGASKAGETPPLTINRSDDR